MAVDDTNTNLVYAVNLGASDASFDLAPGAGVEANVEVTLDGLCIARSFDGGSTFGAGPDPQHFLPGSAFCQRVTPAGAPGAGGVDKTAVTVDWRGRIWLATEDRLDNTIAIFHSVDNARNWNRFVRIQPCTGAPGDSPDCLPQDQLQFLGEFEPVLKTSPSCRSFITPDCSAAPNGFGTVWLETAHVPDTGATHLETLNFGSAYDPSIQPLVCTTGGDCSSGVCSATGLCGCSSDADCDAKLHCDIASHSCKSRSCASNMDCQGGWVCEDQVCSQPSSWAGGDLNALCGITNVLQGPVLAVYGVDNSGDGPQDGSHSLRGAFRHSFDVGEDQDSYLVYRFAYLYVQAATSQLRVQVAQLDANGKCSVPSGWSTESIDYTPGSQEFWPAIDWTERSAQPLAGGSSVGLEWQLGYLSNRYVVDQDKRYVSPFGSTLGTLFGQKALTSSIYLAPEQDGVIGPPSDSYLCARSEGYWGDYFGLTQFVGSGGLFGLPGGPYWLNAATFTFSAHRTADAEPVCSVDGRALGLPMSVYGFTWPSSP